MALFDTAVTAAASYFGGKEANKTNIKLQREQNDWNAQMAATQHQRQVADLRAAGLNPRLSAMGGSGSSVPSTAPAQVKDAISPAVQNALTARRNAAEVKNMEEQNKNMQETNKLINAQTGTAKAQAANYTANTQGTAADNVLKMMDAKLATDIGITPTSINSASGIVKLLQPVAKAGQSVGKWLTKKQF